MRYTSSVDKAVCQNQYCETLIDQKDDEFESIKLDLFMMIKI